VTSARTTSGIPIELHIRPDQHSSVYVSAQFLLGRGSLFGLEFKEYPNSKRNADSPAVVVALVRAGVVPHLIFGQVARSIWCRNPPKLFKLI